MSTGILTETKYTLQKVMNNKSSVNVIVPDKIMRWNTGVSHYNHLLFIYVLCVAMQRQTTKSE
jgi:hypothetical protein